MIKTKSKNAITLVALIITIVLLLIVATVAIRPITNDGIISVAKDSKKNYEEMQEKEAIDRAILTACMVSKNGRITPEELQKALDAELRSR